MPAVWPTSLPEYLNQDSYAESPPDVTIRTQMDAGPTKTRRRFTTNSRFLTGTIQIDSAQRVTLDTFYVSTLAGGALSFEWVHPVTRAVADFKFTAAPSYRAVSGLVFQATLPLELLP